MSGSLAVWSVFKRTGGLLKFFLLLSILLFHLAWFQTGRLETDCPIYQIVTITAQISRIPILD